jgi:hypothetical protein
MAQNNCTPVYRRTVIDVTDPEYFCNKSWTLSFNFNTKSWISFHSYIPNWYVAENNFFYSGLNGGCDLSAIAFEEVPFTTSSTTTPCIGCKPPEPTTTTTTTVLDCEIEGNFVIQPNPTTTTTSSSTSTSTTTSTTTICPSCFTYTITNTTLTLQPVTLTSCYTNEEYVIYLEAGSFINACSCNAPFADPGVGFAILAFGECINCFCYTVTNDTDKTSDFTYVMCDGTFMNTILLSGETVKVCAQQSSVISFFPLTITGGTLPCSTSGDCP